MNQMNGNWNLVIKYRQADKQTDNGWWRRAMQLAGMSSERSSAHERVREGVDYDRARLTWMWDVTSIADKKIIDHNQKGVNSRYYRPGPYGPMEVQASQHSTWYLDQIRPNAEPER